MTFCDSPWNFLLIVQRPTLLSLQDLAEGRAQSKRRFRVVVSFSAAGVFSGGSLREIRVSEQGMARRFAEWIHTSARNKRLSREAARISFRAG